MAQGKLYGVGVGPGDPELLTLKAVRILRGADVIAVPDKGRGEQTALRIVKAYVEGKPLLYCGAPMVRERAALDNAHDAAAASIRALLDEGKTVAYITLGDPSIYSTYAYIHRRVKDNGYDAEFVPGVPSFCAAAAKLGVSLCEGRERLLVVPAGRDGGCLDFDANLVLMKAGKGLDGLREKLDAHGLLDGASAVARCGMDGEQVWRRLADAPDETGYFTVVLVDKR